MKKVFKNNSISDMLWNTIETYADFDFFVGYLLHEKGETLTVFDNRN